MADRLGAVGVTAEPFGGLVAAAGALRAGRVATLVVAAEAASNGQATALGAALDSQPEWSDIPLVLLASPDQPAAEAARVLGRLGARQSATVLHRPVSTASLVAAVQLALVARGRQHQVRGLLAELRQFNEGLEAEVERRAGEVRRLAKSLTLAEQEERRRIAYLLHDDLQQRLYGLHITLSMAGTSTALDGPDAEKLASLLDRAERAVEETAALTRSLSHDLAPPVLRDADLGVLLEWLAQRAETTYGLAVEVVGRASVAEEGVRVLLYQVVRELLFNVAKHAGTGRARVRAGRNGDRVRVEVEDDGTGFDPSALGTRSDGGLGLGGARERVALVGGRLDVRSAPGRGTQVTVEVPSPDGKAAERPA